MLPRRESDLAQLYAAPDVATKVELIDKYGIAYIVVGQTERVYPMIDGNECVAQDVSDGIAVIESMVGSELEVAFSQGTTTVYRVVR